MASPPLLLIFLEAAIAGQMALFALFLFASGRAAPARLALGGFAALIGSVALINAALAAGAPGWARDLTLALELMMAPGLMLIVQQLRLDPPALRAWMMLFLAPAIAGVALWRSGLVGGMDAYVMAVHLSFFGLALAGYLRDRARYEAAPLRRFVTSLLTVFAAFTFLRLVISIDARAAGGFRDSLVYPLILGVLLLLSSRMIWLALRHPEVLAAPQAFRKYARTPIEAAVRDTLEERLDAALDAERAHLDPALDLAALAERIGATPRELSQVVNQRHGLSVPALINRRRAEAAAALLLDEPERPVTEILFEAGFQSKSAFNREFSRRYGMSPTAYRAQGPQAD
jgi:AraC-like DNA-binding protein